MLYIAVYLRCIPSSIVTFLDALYGFECKIRRTNILIISIVIMKGKVNARLQTTAMISKCLAVH